MAHTDWKARVYFKTYGHPADSSSITLIEDAIGVSLPVDYKVFLTSDGGGDIRDGLTRCTYPTPFGRHNITTLHSVDEILGLLDSTVTPRNMISVGFGHFGMTTCLSVAGIDHGHVFALDTEMRYFWSDETISRFPSLDESIKRFFQMRDADELPERPWGYENCYHIADSFPEFLTKLHVHS